MSDRSATVASALTWARGILAEAGIPWPEVDSALLLGHVLDLGRGEIATKELVGSTIAPDAEAAFRDLVARRATREPLQHITGLAPFRSLLLHVGPGVFVPRPETEAVAQIAIDALRARAEEAPIAVDLGTGSGALALSLAVEVPQAHVYAVELSPEAAVWTERNIASTGARVDLTVGDLAEALSELDGTVSVVVSNPPYIPLGMVPRDPEVRLFDPRLALYGGDDGLDVVRSLSRRALRLLIPGGTLVIEHGEQQGQAIRELLRADGWHATATHPDLTLRDRATTALR
ncbi:MAG: protein-(glutamine-N5) methyltransferase, release factor-specific [Frondihabitans sp.]|nr:protein-(glutamine-N5) methyltransferase, release factor-specific [Frondihabitans sp.]